MTVPVSVVILSYNTLALTLDCLARFADPALEQGWQVILVDNGSTDGTAQAVAARFPGVEVIRVPENQGYAAGNNRGLVQARGEAVILLNSDVEATPEALQALVDYLNAHPDVAAVSAGLRTPDGQPQAFAFGDEPAPGYLLRRGLGRLLGRAPLHDWAVDHPVDVDWVSGACLAVRRQALEQVGLLDEGFFLYFEDVDWCLRMRRAGWRVVYNPSIQVIHLGGASEPGRSTANHLYHESLVRFYHKHYGRMWGATVRLSVTMYRWLAETGTKRIP